MPTRPKPIHATFRRRNLPALILTAAVALVTPTPSGAAPGTFTVHSCGTPESKAGPATGWYPFNLIGPYFGAVTNTCMTTGVMEADDGYQYFTSYSFSVGEGAGFAFSAPGGQLVTRVKLDQHVAVSSRGGPGDFGAVALFPILSGSTTDFIDWCKSAIDAGCFGTITTGPGYIKRDTVTEYRELNDKTIALDLRCRTPPGACVATNAEPILMRVNRVETDLTETPAGAPTTSSVQGSLTTANVLRGDEGLTFQATDNAAGVYRAVVVFGSQEFPVRLDGMPPTCVDARPSAGPAYEFASPTPCPTSGSFSATVDTTRLPEGTATLDVYVEDASGLRSKVLGPKSVTIDNDYSVPNLGPSGGGDGGITAPFVGVPTNGTNASNAARIRISGVRRRTVRFGRSFKNMATITDEAGRPVSGAQVTVLERMRVPGARWEPAQKPLVTDAQGRVRWTVPAKFSRTIRLAYKANVANTEFQATSDLVVTVLSKTTLKKNESFFRNGETIRFTGRVVSRPLPSSGVLIDLQAKVASGWQTFRTTRTSSSGRWSSSYRFHATRGLQRYRFRARVRRDTGFPYAPSASKPIEVAVFG